MDRLFSWPSKIYISPQSYNFNMLQLLLDGATWSWPFESLLSSRRYCFRGMSLLFPRMSLLMLFLFCLLSIDPFLHFLNRPIFFIFQSSRSKRNKDFAIAGIRTFNLRVSRQILTPGTTVPRLNSCVIMSKIILAGFQDLRSLCSWAKLGMWPGSSSCFWVPDKSLLS